MSEGVFAYIGIGANLGDREAALTEALEALHAHPKITIAGVSSLYQTAPVGITDQPHFLNAVAALQTTLSAEALLDALLQTEKKLGRVRTKRWGPRVIDMDLLLYGDQVITGPGLDVPHPRMQDRAFVLIPLSEIAPDLLLPHRSKSVRETLQSLTDTGGVEFYRSDQWEQLRNLFGQH